MKHDLSERELAVLNLAAKGFTDDGIARELGIQKGTVNSYWVRIRGKMGHLGRTELVARHVQGNADKLATTELERANGHAQESQKLLMAASKEIERLKELLKERR